MQPTQLGIPIPTWRTNQEETIQKIVEVDKPVFVLEAPTGTGKTFIGAGAARLMAQKGKPKAVYLVTTKHLQDQISTPPPRGLGGLPYYAMLKGKNNYVCGEDEERTAEDCGNCPVGSGCPYRTAKRRAREAGLTVLNYAYWLTIVNMSGEFSAALGTDKHDKGDFDFIVCDEADTIEDQLMNYISVSFTEGELGKLVNMGAPSPEALATPEDWHKWALAALPVMAGKLKTLDKEMEKHREEFMQQAPVPLVRERTRLANKYTKLTTFVDEFEWSPWVITIEQSPRTGRRWELKPVIVAPFANGVMWRHASRSLHMSATILNAGQYCRNLGIPDYKENAVVRSLPCLFPVDNRRVKYQPVTEMKRDNREQAWPKMTEAIGKILKAHPNEKGIVHTVSYQFARYLIENLRDKRLLSHESGDRDSTVRFFHDAKDPLVLVSPSINRGVDFRDDAARFNIVAKVPYPYLGDAQIQARVNMPGGWQWYSYKTVSTLVQSTGRTTRADDDWSVSYILDSEFDRLYKQQNALFPGWWKEALV